jgi:hypothetical protein
LIVRERIGGAVAQAEAEAVDGTTAFEGVETIPFDGGVVAHNRATGALCLLNGTGGEALALLQAGTSEPAAAELIAARYGVARDRVAADLAGLRAALAQAGLLAGAAEADAGGWPAGETDAGGAASAEASPALADAVFDAIVSCGGTAVRLRCEEAALGRLVAAVTRPARSGAAPAVTVELAGSEGGYRCRRDGRLVWSCGPRPLARRNLLREAILATLPAAPAALLHASAVVLGGRALLLAGDSGSGKTTLAAALVGRGGLLIADDLLPLLPDGRIAPVAFALSLKAGSWPLLAPLFPRLARLPVHTSRGLKVRYLWPGAARAARQPQLPAAILFPARRSGAAPEWQRLSPRQSVERLIDSGTSLEQVEGALGVLARFAEETPAFALAYDGLDDGAAAVTALLREGSGPLPVRSAIAPP